MIHQSEEAAAHIRKKYEYFRNKIKITEQFIEYSASRSTMIGQCYTVRWQGAGADQSAQDWMLQELEIYRSKNRP